MKQHGALFTSENRLAIREGRKTQTRRIPASFKEINEHPDGWEFIGFEDELASFRLKGDESIFLVKLPWAIGDELYIKEPFHCPNPQAMPVSYKDNLEPQQSIRQTWQSPLFMPKWAARDWLRVTGVKVERLQSISELDCLKEGIGANPPLNNYGSGSILRDDYAQLWDSINGKKYPWERNEWVVAYTFKRITK
jgi:hypothetical protein